MEQKMEICCWCHKELKPTRHKKLYVNIDNTTGDVIPLDAKPAHGQFGAQPIGLECAKTFEKYMIGA